MEGSFIKCLTLCGACLAPLLLYRTVRKALKSAILGTIAIMPSQLNMQELTADSCPDRWLALYRVPEASHHKSQ